MYKLKIKLLLVLYEMKLGYNTKIVKRHNRTYKTVIFYYDIDIYSFTLKAIYIKKSYFKIKSIQIINERNGKAISKSSLEDVLHLLKRKGFS